MLDDTEEISVAPDDMDCNTASLSIIATLKAGALSSQKLLVTNSSWASLVSDPNTAHGATGKIVCATGFYIKVKEVKPMLSVLVMLTLVASSAGLIMKLLGNVVKAHNTISAVTTAEIKPEEAGASVAPAPVSGN